MAAPAVIGARRAKRRALLRRLSPLGWASLVLVVLAVAMALFPQLFATDDPFAIAMGQRLRPPSAAAWFGTDELGRDLYSRVVHGVRLSLGSALGVVLLTALVGIPIGILAGYLRGWFDTVLMRVADMFIAFPSLIMAMAIVTVLGPGLTNAMIALALVWWPQYARLARGQVLQLRETQYVEAAGALGATSARIMTRHLLPNALTPLAVKMSLDVSVAILTTASFSFLGLGAAPPSPELGSLVTQGRNYFLQAWWYTTMPGAVILVVSLAFNVIADDLRDVLDPSLRY
jgi:peptide/nickel transport system permease protein